MSNMLLLETFALSLVCRAEVADGGSLSAFSDESVDLLTANMGIIFFADASK